MEAGLISATVPWRLFCALGLCWSQNADAVAAEEMANADPATSRLRAMGDDRVTASDKNLLPLLLAI